MNELARTLEEVEIYTTLTVSTAHIPYRDNLMLQKAGTPDHPAEKTDPYYIGSIAHEPVFAVEPLVVISTTYGYLVYCSNIEDEGQVQAIVDYGYTTALTDLLQLGFAKGCRYVNLDCDGPTYESIQQFSW